MNKILTNTRSSARAWMISSRLNSFTADRSTDSLKQAIDRLASVEGVSAVELNYPQHIKHVADTELLTHAATLGLRVTGLNLRFDPPVFTHGSLCHKDEAVRNQAIAIARDAMGFASEHGIDHVILWLGPDGFDYPFECDYGQAIDLAVAGVQAIADVAQNVRLSIEYKPSEPRARSIVRGMADALLIARESGLDNVGVTLDFCHSLMAGEAPALEAARALREGKLFGLHLNDGYGPADDGLIVGSVHPVETVELLYVLKQFDWTGTVYFDTFPSFDSAVSECTANVHALRRLANFADRIESEVISRMRTENDAYGLQTYIANRMMAE